MLWQGQLSAQELNFRHLSAHEGLPSTQVSAFHHDSSGYMWIGTLDQGLFLYEGFKFTPINTRHGLAGNTIRTILATVENDVLVGTDKGMSIVKTDTIVSYTIADGLPHNRINTACLISDQSILLGTSKGLALFKSGKITALELPQSIAECDIRDILLDKTGRLWLATFSHGLIRAEFTSGAVKVHTIFNETRLQTKQVVDLAEDKNGLIWVGTSGRGLFRFDGDFTNYSFENNVGANYLNSIVVDHKNRIWGTSWGGGIVRYDSDGYHLIGKENGLMDQTTISSYCDQRGVLWFGYYTNGLSTYLGDGLMRYDQMEGEPLERILNITSNDQFVGVVHNLGLILTNTENEVQWSIPHVSNSNEFLCVAPDENGNAYAGTSFGHLYFLSKEEAIQLPNTEELNSEITGIIYDKARQKLFIRAIQGNLYVYDLPSSSLQAVNIGEGNGGLYLKSFDLDAAGRLWIGTKSGLFLYENGKAVRVDAIPQDVQITSIDQDGELLYFGTHRYGLGRYNIGSKEMRFYHKDQDFPVDNVLGVAMGQNKLQVTTIREILNVTFNPDETANIELVTGAEELMRSQFLEGAIENVQGELWVGTKDGLLIYDYIKDSRNNDANLKLYIQEVKMYKDTALLYATNVRIGADPSLMIPADGNKIEVNYSGVQLDNSYNIQYQYYLDGYSSEWSTPSSDLQTTFVNLSPGQYTYKLRMVDVFSAATLVETEIVIEQLAPVYQTTFFYIIIGLAIMGMLFIFYLIFRSNVNRDLPLLDLQVRRNLKTNRVLLLLGALLYPSFGFIYHGLVEGVIDPPMQRLAIGVILIIANLLSFRIEFVARHLGPVLESGFYLITLHLFYLFYINDLMPEYALGLFLVLMVVSLIIISISRVIIYGVVICVLSFVVYYLAPGEGFNPNFFLVSILTAALLSFLVVTIKVEITRRSSFVANLLNHNSHISMVFNEDGKAVYITNNTFNILKITKNNLMKKGWVNYFSLIEKGQVIADANLLNNFTNPLLKKYFVQFKNPKTGEEHILQFENDRLKGNLIYAQGLDVTASQEEEQNYRRFRAIISNVHRGILVCDVKGKIIWCNEYFTKLTGFELEDVVGKRSGDLLSGPETDLNKVGRARLLANENQPFDIESIGYTKFNEKLMLSITSTPLFNEAGEVEEFVEIFADVSKTREELLALEEVKSRFRDMLNHTQDLILVLDGKGNILHVNKAWKDFIGEDKLLVGRSTIWEHIYPPKLEDFQEKVKESQSHPGVVIDANVILMQKRGDGFRMKGLLKTYEEAGKPRVGCIFQIEKEG